MNIIRRLSANVRQLQTHPYARRYIDAINQVFVDPAINALSSAYALTPKLGRRHHQRPNNVPVIGDQHLSSLILASLIRRRYDLLSRASEKSAASRAAVRRTPEPLRPHAYHRRRRTRSHRQHASRAAFSIVSSLGSVLRLGSVAAFASAAVSRASSAALTALVGSGGWHLGGLADCPWHRLSRLLHRMIPSACAGGLCHTKAIAAIMAIAMHFPKIDLMLSVLPSLPTCLVSKS